jgi:hypothetical protein
MMSESLLTATNNLATSQTAYIAAQADFPMSYVGIVGG